MKGSHLLNRTSWMRTVPIMLATLLFVTGCFLDGRGRAVTPSELTVSPAYICPLDPITVTWNVPTTTPCWEGRPTTDDTLQCSTVNSAMSSNAETPFETTLYEQSGTRSYDPGPSMDTTFSFTAIQFTRSRGAVRENLTASVDVIEVPTSVTAIANGLCADNEMIDTSALFSACVEVDQICVASTNPPENRYVISGSPGCAPGTPPDACLESTFTSDELRIGECISPSDVRVATFRNLAFVDIDMRPDPLGTGGLDPRRDECTVEGGGFNPDLNVTFRTACTGAYPGCN